MRKDAFYGMLYLLIVVCTGLISCSKDDEQAREQGVCDCTVTTIIYEDDTNDTTIISQTSQEIRDECTADGKFLSSIDVDGHLITNEWSCR